MDPTVTFIPQPPLVATDPLTHHLNIVDPKDTIIPDRPFKLGALLHHHHDAANIKEDATKLVGDTPLVRLNKVTKGCVATVVAKQEMFLPTATNKDRTALYLINDAEKQGKIIPGLTTLIEPTSGNMGISVAFMATIRGHRAIITMPANTGIERRIAIRALGAHLVLTDPKKGVAGAIKVADYLKKCIPYAHSLDAFENPANTEAHFSTTGPEIWKATNGKVGIFVMGIGTGGTLAGAAQYLKCKNPNVKIYGVEPAESAVYNGGKPGPHGIIGIGGGFKSKLVDEKIMEKVLMVKTEDALAMARRLAHEEGLLVGIASGANTVAALELAKLPENKHKLIVTIHSSYGERYFSTQLYEKLKEECENMEPVPVPEDDEEEEDEDDEDDDEDDEDEDDDDDDEKDDDNVLVCAALQKEKPPTLKAKPATRKAKPACLKCAF